MSRFARILFYSSLGVAALSVVLKLNRVDSSNEMRCFYGFCLGLWFLRIFEFLVERSILIFTTGLVALDRRLSRRDDAKPTALGERRMTHTRSTSAVISPTE
jgi:hypothetical protein